MAIFENRKKGHSRIIKLFGNVIYITTSGYKRKTQRFFGNFISTQKTNDENDNQIKVTKILDYVISKRETTERYRKTYFLGKLVSFVDLNKKFTKKYKKHINGYKNIIIIHSNSGEAYLFLTYVLDAFLKKNNIDKNILLVATKKYHMDLINLLCPEIPHCYIARMRLLKKNYININGYNCYMVFTGQHFVQVENDIKNSPLNTAHYFYAITDELGIKKEDLGFRQVKISEDLKNRVITKARKIGLNLDKFVFIAPEAVSCEEYDNEFWVDLCKELQHNGYDTFFNIVDKDTDIVGCSYKTCNLTFAEAFVLAKMSKGVVSLRSGLTESLLQTNVPLFSLYTKFRDRYVFNDMDIEYVLSGFGLNKLPNVDTQKVFEFNMSEENNEKVINQIITKIQGKPDEVI